MSKGLEVWNVLKKYLNKYHHQIVKDDIELKTIEGMPLNTIEEELKAFEIIKQKKVDLEYLKCCDSYEQYNLICSYWNEITKGDFDLLKKVLK